MATQVSTFINNVEITLDATVIDDNNDIIDFEVGENLLDDFNVTIGINVHDTKKFAALLAEQYSYDWDMFESSNESVVVFYGSFSTDANTVKSFEYWRSNDDIFNVLDWINPEDITIIQG